MIYLTRLMRYMTLSIEDYVYLLLMSQSVWRVLLMSSAEERP